MTAALKLEKEKYYLRFNENHDEHGRFASSDSSGSGGAALLDDEFKGSGSVDDPANINKVVDGKIKMTYVKVKGQNTQNYGSLYGQDIEPAGEYMSMDTLKGANKIQGFEYGTIKFNKPLIVDWKSTGANGWKKDLSEKYGGKTGKKLSNALKKDGYDAIITVDGGYPSEIVNLNGEKANGQRSLDFEKQKFYVRFNENHDEHGRFASSDGSGSSGSSAGGSGSDTDAKIADLEKQLSEAKGLIAKSKIKTQINMLKEGFTGTAAEYNAMKAKQREEAAQKSLEKQQHEKELLEQQKEKERQDLENELKTQPKDKVEQYQIIQKTNPMNDDYHVGIRKPSDIKTWQEVVESDDGSGESFAWGDFSKADAEKALKTGKITLYSSYPIKDGTFVSTSKAQAEMYAGGKGGKVYSQTVDLKDVAWINGDEGQFAQLPKRMDINMKDDFEIRSYAFDLATEQTEAGGIITGRPIVYNSKTNLGMFDEIIERGALDKTDLRDVRFLVNHDTSKIPLARSRNNNANSTMQLIPDEKGLQVKVKLDIENNSEARNLYSAIKRGDVSGMSFMFNVPKGGDDWDFTNAGHPERRIKSISNVVEVSAVTFPAYADTEISVRNKAALDSAKATLDSVKKAQQDALESEARSALELAKAKFYAKIKM